MRDEFVQEVEAFIKAYRIPPSKFGREAVKDGSFVADLKSGKRDLKVSTIERVRKFMRDYERDHARV